jgi:uncharacterized protein involved in response to NO
VSWKKAASQANPARRARTIALHPSPAVGDDTAWRWRRLLDAPHRLAFFAGMLMLAATAAWWAAAILARTRGVAWPWTVPPGVAHGLLMTYGFLPLFFAGFLFTAGPRWLARAPVEAATLRVALAASVAGGALFIVGVHTALALAAGGVALAAAGFANLTLRFAALVGASRVAERQHAVLILAGCAIGALLLAGAAVALAWQRFDLVGAAVHAGLWGCIGLVFIAVSHRMLPFFSADVLPWLERWRPGWLLWTPAAAMLAEAVLAAVDVLGAPLPAALRFAQALGEAGMAGLLLWLALRWGLLRSLKFRLLAMLHIGFAWLGAAFVLGAVSHAMMAASADARSLGLAPLHALAGGFFGSTLLAMVTRVSAGHSGRAIAADGVVWPLFWLLQGAVVARLGAALWTDDAPLLLALAALAWAVATGAWALRCVRWYGQPRSDGRPG